MVQIIGHRGARGLEPENTMRSFQKALELGVDYIECDVHITNDDHIVLMHDHTVDRTTNGSGAVNSFTFYEIRELNAGKGETIPTLQELLDLARGRVKLHIELKDEAATEPTVRLVEKNGMEEEVFFTSGNTDTLKRVQELNASISTEHIFGKPPDDAIDRALGVGAKRVSCHINHLTAEFVQKAHENGLQVIAWPPNTVEEAKKATKLESLPLRGKEERRTPVKLGTPPIRATETRKLGIEEIKEIGRKELEKQKEEYKRIIEENNNSD